jgi:hypothetical protein
MKQASKLLVVEGYFDKLFFDALLQRLGIDDIDISECTESTIPQTGEIKTYGGKNKAIERFITALGRLQRTSGLQRLALIVDADFSDFPNLPHEGYASVVQRIENQLKDKDYNRSSTNHSKEIYFENSLSNRQVALWVMPNNQDDGYLEYLLFNALKEAEQELSLEAKKIADEIKNKRYSPQDQQKAMLAIAMAMLKDPGRDSSYLVKKGILNLNQNTVLKDLINFLQNYFK